MGPLYTDKVKPRVDSFFRLSRRNSFSKKRFVILRPNSELLCRRFHKSRLAATVLGENIA
jgi:hypothetical protein